MKCEICQGKGFIEYEHGLIMVECGECKEEIVEVIPKVVKPRKPRKRKSK